jgi:hypothetical protein
MCLTKNINGNVLNVGNIFESAIHVNCHKQSNFNNLPRCLNCYPFIQGFSNIEKELVEFCKQYYPNLIENDRQLLSRTRVRYSYS